MFKAFIEPNIKKVSYYGGSLIYKKIEDLVYEIIQFN